MGHTKLECKHEFVLNATGFLRKKVAKTKFGPDSVLFLALLCFEMGRNAVGSQKSVFLLTATWVNNINLLVAG